MVKVNEYIAELATILPKPLYVVGGYVRNYLIDGTISSDIDLASPLTVEELLPYLENFKIKATYKRTNTIVFEDAGKNEYEYTTFRKELYSIKGAHTPTYIEPTTNIEDDARRRDFKCNAVYYDIKNQKIVDPLGGVEDIKNKVLNTTVSPKKVFNDDGLRLMRLCRFYGELNFEPTEEVINQARINAKNILQISQERIFAELKMMLQSDSKYSFSNEYGHYYSLKMLVKIGVFEYLFPELYKGNNMPQRKDFHKYDVLEHSLKCVYYSHSSIRLAALLHDVGKPYCMINFNEYHGHAEEGEKIAKNILERLKASKKEIEEICSLVKYHMLDIKLDTRANKIKKYIVYNKNTFQKMLYLKQADYSASKDDISVAPTVDKWKKIYSEMIKTHTPFTKKELQIDGTDLLAIGFKGKQVGSVLEALFLEAVYHPHLNKKESLINLALKMLKAK